MRMNIHADLMTFLPLLVLLGVSIGTAQSQVYENDSCSIHCSYGNEFVHDLNDLESLPPKGMV